MKQSLSELLADYDRSALAKRLGCGLSTIGSWCTGRGVPRNHGMVHALAKAVGRPWQDVWAAIGLEREGRFERSD
jgi:hypothetical protein